MFNSKSMPLFVALFSSILLSVSGQAAAAGTTVSKTGAALSTSQGVAFSLVLAADGKTYQVLMKPSKTPKPDISLSGQVTIKVPHQSAFKATAVVSAIAGANWVEASRVDAPKEDKATDYISFSFVGLQGSSSRNFAWKEGKEQLVFSFQNEGGCVSGVTLIAKDDPFNVSPNSASTNPGNYFANLGWGDISQNNYQGNYGTAIVCPK